MNANAAISAAIEIRKELIKATAEICNGEDSRKIGMKNLPKEDPAVGISYLEALHKFQEERELLVQ